MPESPSSALRHVFVYGTLRRGETNDINLLSPSPRYLGQARIEGVMHHLGAYPGVRLTPGAAVLGEVYAIAPEVERRLDEIEMILPEPTGEYLKRELVVGLDGADVQHADAPRSLVCIVYEISPAHAAGRPVIASGDWVADKDA
jgi:gamma-glutamylcyclotransferase (GGCT)/AIG2-like uncharacterized protein YtfP